MKCPNCEQELEVWQGKDGPNGLFVWVEGERSPADQCVDEEVALSRDARARLALPNTFVIYCYDCHDHGRVEAECSTTDGVWSSTIIRQGRANEVAEDGT